ncbi:MAG: type II 3-dehydroquinate dehydratase [Hyphomicrobiaceae bacterium]|nr:type II 3-dehydroquinate dehydratase [Hyphomicrobiaceae bacterium]
MLGKREPQMYGSTTLQEIETDCRYFAQDNGFELTFYQSNNECMIIEWIQNADGVADGIIINPAAFTHTSIAILDALKTVRCPIVEIHISNPYQRERFRHISYVSQVATGTICGFGAYGYILALSSMLNLLK